MNVPTRGDSGQLIEIRDNWFEDLWLLNGGAGGAVYLNTLYSSQFAIYNNTFLHCKADIGAALLWNHYQPSLIRNNTFGDNYAVYYGDSVASYAARLSLWKEGRAVEIPPVVEQHQSGAALSSFEVALLDADGQVVTSDTESEI